MNRVKWEAKTLASRRYPPQALGVADSRNLEHTHHPVQASHPRTTDKGVAVKITMVYIYWANMTESGAKTLDVLISSNLPNNPQNNIST